MKIVQITGTATANKGAELLLLAVRQQLASALPEAKLAVTPDFGSFDDRAQYGLRTVLPEAPRGRWWLAGRMMPQAFRETCGVVAESDVDAVLDASGFAFSDQLGVKRVRSFADDVRRWKKQGKPVVLLPQALGPFDQSDVRDAFQEVVDHCDLLFARDPVSFEYVQQLTTHDKLRLAPDFTNLVQCTSSGWQSDDTYDSLIIPNHRMLEKTDPTTRDQYIPFLARCFQELEALDMRPAVLLHDNRIDHQLVDPLKQQLNRDITVISNTNPLVLKSMIGAARLIVGSRFHGLVSALSQGIPAFAAGWSHKYEMLFRDYGCEDRVLSVDLKSTQIRDLFRPVAESWQDSHRSLCEHAHTQRQLAADMWKQVFDVLAQ